MNRPLTHLSIMGLVLVAALVAYGVGYSKISSKSAEVARLEQQIRTENATVSYIASARTALAEIAGDEAAVQAYFVSGADVVSFINDLESRGSALGANVSVLSVSANKTATHPALDLSITVSGSFDAVMRTVGAIEYAPYDVSVTSLTVNKGDAAKWVAAVHLLVGSAPDAGAHLSDTSVQNTSATHTTSTASQGTPGTPQLKQ